ncbi:MAG TPA: LPS export ABC transporter periplasmic protein LptC [Candidatus Methylomirabilis sp.]|nr:LPS export ABC transporter periplasmic protein LptC [Candidatus Methylomirabilis sp.]
MLLTGLVPAAMSLASGADPSSPPVPPEVKLREIHMLETRGGSRLWELWADRAEVREGEGVAVLVRVQRPVEVVLYSSQGRLRCTADRATITLNTKDIRLEGGIVARSEDGAELRTEMLQWVTATRRIQTDQPVMLSRGAWQSRGRGLEAETDLEQVRIFENITSHLPSTVAPPIPAAAPRAGPRTPGRSTTP